ncbi:hypothetical protein [Sneathiella glossodoripedis]|uniref:hypothetical protein n=1 Tax=Sneathiella glossodoripedis TaxID=418853 RepID=UPI00055F3064|nr:hypothetical protein [Sneathiella glossodoripedis]
MFDFPDNINNIDEVPEKYRNLYTENSDDQGGFQLDENLSQMASRASDLQDRIDQLNARESELVIENTAIAALGSVGGNPALLMPFLKNSLQVATGDDGQKTVHVRPDMTGAAGFKPEDGRDSATDLVRYLRTHPDFSAAFTGGQKSGGGMSPAAAGGTTLTLRSTEQSSINAKLEEIAAGKVTVTP